MDTYDVYNIYDSRGNIAFEIMVIESDKRCLILQKNDNMMDNFKIINTVIEEFIKKNNKYASYAFVINYKKPIDSY